MSSNGGVPDVNDLIRITLSAPGDPDGGGPDVDVKSRIEDLTRNRKTGKILSYLISVPRFSGDVVLPAPRAACALNWHTPRGLWTLPTAFESQETTGYGLRVWRLAVTGPPRRDQRRRYVRVPWSLPVELDIRRDLEALDVDRRQLLDHNGTIDLLPDLPESLLSRALNVSEGGLLCMTGGPVLPTYLPLIARFSLDSTPFVIPAYVVWSLLRDERADLGVENALAFDDPGVEGDALRPLLFQAQLKARRAGLT
ncbi:MAG TPA: hypothetical protein VLL08_29080 [Kineosporiaceae bacterium]|nr:hypothetical protein [Kineosporiaceae bacterium]